MSPPSSRSLVLPSLCCICYSSTFFADFFLHSVSITFFPSVWCALLLLLRFWFWVCLLVVAVLLLLVLFFSTLLIYFDARFIRMPQCAPSTNIPESISTRHIFPVQFSFSFSHSFCMVVCFVLLCE